LTTIHPFEDGNGRVSRLGAAGDLTLYALSGHSYADKPFAHHQTQQTPSSISPASSPSGGHLFLQIEEIVLGRAHASRSAVRTSSLVRTLILGGLR
jgi:hypothetical protein